jgi:hypothetical protein
MRYLVTLKAEGTDDTKKNIKTPQTKVFVIINKEVI